jgi:site-specific recombinase XerD
LLFLAGRGKEPEEAQPSDIDAFITVRLRRCIKRNRRPAQLVEWRCGYTGAIHRLLREIQGQWPPATTSTPQIEKFKNDLQSCTADPRYIRDLCFHARQFLDYINGSGLSLEAVKPSQIDEYLASTARRNRHKHWYWMKVHRRSVWKLLRHAQGEWPPGSTPSPLFVQFRAHLKQRHFSIHTIWRHVSSVRRFLDYLRSRQIEPEKARAHDVAGFLEWKLQEYRQQCGRAPKDLARWRLHYRAGIHRFLRMIDPKWPPAEEPANEIERFKRGVSERYVRWMREVRGLAATTVVKDRDAALQFLVWLGSRANPKTLRNLSVSAIDQYFESRMPGLRRATRVGMCTSMRSFLRYLHAESCIDRDLSRFITGPPVYAFAEIPRAFTEEQIRALLKTVRADRRPAALRDYAMLILLATYGIRGGEVVRLRLEDIDWRENRIRIRRSKTGLESYLPLVTPVGNALLNYLRRGRPPSSAREVFLRARAPYDPLVSSGSLVSIIQDRLEQAGIVVEGRRGAHAFRFARAASLLRASVSLKHIGDLLGHQSATATGIYLRLTTDNLRAISLEVPGR